MFIFSPERRGEVHASSTLCSSSTLTNAVTTNLKSLYLELLRGNRNKNYFPSIITKCMYRISDPITAASMYYDGTNSSLTHTYTQTRIHTRTYTHARGLLALHTWYPVYAGSLITVLAVNLPRILHVTKPNSHAVKIRSMDSTNSISASFIYKSTQKVIKI